MKFLLDTHTLIWLLSEPSRVPQSVRGTLFRDGSQCLVSIASLWEMTIKSSNRALDLPGGNISKVIQALRDYTCEVLLVEAEDMATLEQLPYHHKDPFDRMIVSQALRHGMTLVTVDGLLAKYGVPVLWD